MLYFLQHFLFVIRPMGLRPVAACFLPFGLMLTIPGAAAVSLFLILSTDGSIDGISFYYLIATDRWTHTHTLPLRPNLAWTAIP